MPSGRGNVTNVTGEGAKDLYLRPEILGN